MSLEGPAVDILSYTTTTTPLIFDSQSEFLIEVVSDTLIIQHMSKIAIAP